MRFAYADPPYPGQSYRVYGQHEDYAGEVDHAELIAQLERDFPDGWALSTSVTALPEVLALCPYARGTDPKNPGRVEPEASVRVCAWVKPGGQPFPIAVQFGWEPVILRRGRARRWGNVTDTLTLAPSSGRSLRSQREDVTGAKPPGFARWIFALLGAQPGDELVDLFSGSGAIAREWEAWRSQPALPFTFSGPSRAEQMELVG